MKVLALVLSTLVLTALLLGGSIILAVTVPGRPDGLFILASLSITPLFYGPAILGSLLTYYDPARSAQSRKSFTRWAVVVLGLEALGAIGIVVYAIAAGAPAWLPVVFIGVGVLLVLGAWAISGPLRRYDERQDHKVPAWAPVTRAQIFRKIAIVAIVFVITLVVGTLLFALLFSSRRDREEGFGTALNFALDFAFLAAGITCLLQTLGLNRQLRATADRDLGRIRKFVRIVLRGKKEELAEGERVPAARYAAILTIVLPFTLGYITLMYAGLITQTLGMLARAHGSDDPILGPWFIVVLVVVLLVIYPMQILRLVRARRYVREHAELLDGSDKTVAQPNG
jgi:hypothetical protein